MLGKKRVQSVTIQFTKDCLLRVGEGAMGCCKDLLKGFFNKQVSVSFGLKIKEPQGDLERVD